MFCLGIICMDGDAFALALKYIMQAWAEVRLQTLSRAAVSPPAATCLDHCAALPLPQAHTHPALNTRPTLAPAACLQVEAFVLDTYKQAMEIGRDLLQSTPALWDKMGDAAADVAKKMCEVTPCSSAFTQSVEVGGLCT